MMQTMNGRVLSFLRCCGVLAGACTLASACGPEFAVIPQGGLRQFTANASGVTVTAFADQWEADPRDLADALTPIAVDLHNGTGTEIRVSLNDFLLGGQDGVRTPAVSPFQVPLAAVDEPLHGPLLAGPLQVGVKYAAVHIGAPGGGFRGGGFRGGGYRGGGYRGGGYRGGWGYRGGYLTGGRRWGSYGWGPRWGRGFYVAGGLRGYYGPGVAYWSGAWGWPGYSVYAWSDGGYRYEPSSDVLELALPEGVLAPGAHVNGFLYFRKSTAPHVRSLTMTWEPHDARTGNSLGQAQIALDVIRR